MTSPLTGAGAVLKLSLHQEPMEAAPARTSGKDCSIWKPLNENTFRKHIMQLCSISKDVPVDPHMHTKEARRKRSERTELEDASIPFTVEMQVADDFAFLAAATEGAHSVSAAAIETVEDPKGLIIRLAANNGVASPVKQALTEMLDSLQLCGSGGKRLRLGHDLLTMLRRLRAFRAKMQNCAF